MGWVGVRIQSRPSPSVLASIVCPGESVFRSRLAYGRSGGERVGGERFAVAALGLNAKRRPHNATRWEWWKNAASSIAIGRKESRIRMIDLQTPFCNIGLTYRLDITKRRKIYKNMPECIASLIELVGGFDCTRRRRGARSVHLHFPFPSPLKASNDVWPLPPSSLFISDT